MAMTAREHLEWASERALEYYDHDDKTNALSSFMSDIGKHEDTAWIQTHALGFPLLMLEVNGSRESFKAAMLGYSV